MRHHLAGAEWQPPPSSPKSPLPSIVSPNWGQVSGPFITQLCAFSSVVHLRRKRNITCPRQREFVLSLNPLHSFWYFPGLTNVCLCKPLPAAPQDASWHQDAKEGSLECFYLCIGQGRITRQLLCLLAYFHSNVGSNCKTKSCSSKKVRCGFL